MPVGILLSSSSDTADEGRISIGAVLAKGVERLLLGGASFVRGWRKDW